MRLLSEQKDEVEQGFKKRGVDYDRVERGVEEEVERSVKIIDSFNDMTREYPWLRPIQTGQPRDRSEQEARSAGLLHVKNGETW